MAEVHSRRTARIASDAPTAAAVTSSALDDEVRVALGQGPVPEGGRIGAHEVGHDDLPLAVRCGPRATCRPPGPGATPSPEASGEDLGDHLVRRALGDGSGQADVPTGLAVCGERGRIQLADPFSSRCCPPGRIRIWGEDDVHQVRARADLARPSRPAGIDQVSRLDLGEWP